MLKYLLLVIFIVLTVIMQSGKSAAIYACAKEEGFQVIEVTL